MDMSEGKAFLLTMELTQGSILPMALKTAIELDLFELINKAPGSSISASDLAAQLPTTNPGAGKMIDRILCLLAAHDVVICRVVDLPDGGIERKYSPAPVSKFLTKNEEGISLASMSMLIQDSVVLNTWLHLKDAILQGGVAFDRAYGMQQFQYPAVDQRYNKIFNEAMLGHTTLFMNKLLQMYTGFEGLKTLVDVGGGVGITLKMILDKYPSILGINFDLPHVISEAPPSPGIEHVAGDMFVSVPKANAIFMKWICHIMSDEHCRKLFKNCYEALDDDGKVIIVDSVMENEPNGGLDFRRVAAMDVLMMTVNHGGRERTEMELNSIAEDVGFRKLTKVCCVYDMWIMELHK